MSIDAAGTLAGLFGVWAIVASGAAFYLYRRLQALQQQQQEPKHRAALAAIRRAFTASAATAP